MNLRSTYPIFIRFSGLSGLGWVLDVALLLALVSYTHIAPFYANLFSSSVAATSVFLISREWMFHKAPRALHLRIALYLIYTFSVILVCSYLLGSLVLALTALALSIGVAPSEFAVAGAAKVLITPPQLLLNFLVSRFLSEHSMLQSGDDNG